MILGSAELATIATEFVSSCHCQKNKAKPN